jgi:hypothetical protein
MAIRCAVTGCERSGWWLLKLLFVQAKPKGWDPRKEQPRVCFTVDTEGAYCDEHKRTLPVESFVTPFEKSQVDAWFLARNLGLCAHEETKADWSRAADAPPADEPKVVTVRM